MEEPPRKTLRASVNRRYLELGQLNVEIMGRGYGQYLLGLLK